MLTVSIGKRVLCSSRDVSIATVDNCEHEEADTKAFLHALSVVLDGHESILLLTVDSDWDCLAPRAFIHLSGLGLKEMWLGLGNRSNRYMIITITDSTIHRLDNNKYLLLSFIIL